MRVSAAQVNRKYVNISAPIHLAVSDSHPCVLLFPAISCLGALPTRPQSWTRPDHSSQYSFMPRAASNHTYIHNLPGAEPSPYIKPIIIPQLVYLDAFSIIRRRRNKRHCLRFAHLVKEKFSGDPFRSRQSPKTYPREKPNERVSLRESGSSLYARRQCMRRSAEDQQKGKKIREKRAQYLLPPGLGS